MSRLSTNNIRSRRLTVEALEHRTLLAADVVAETAEPLPQNPLPSDTNLDGCIDQFEPHWHSAQAHGRTEIRQRLQGDTAIDLDFNSAYLDQGLLVVPFSMTVSGISTHFGRFEVAGSGTVKFDVSSGTPIPVLTEASGCTTILATGDEICWVGEEIGTSQHATITYTDGTGRFEDVEGGFSYDYTPNPGNPPDSITYSFVGIGTITF